MITISLSAEARPRREIRSFNPGVHRSFPSRSSGYQRSGRSCYNCGYPTPYYRGSQRSYQRRSAGGYSRSGYSGGYRDYHGYPRRGGRSRIRIEYEGNF
ncbi:MAG: hypothetical protein AB4041_17665 [Microcystaceae cyanobacterium]